MDKIKINEEKKIIDLETAITEGANALIPYEFEYPNSDLIVEVQLKPITNPELQKINSESKIGDTSPDIKLLEHTVFNIDGSSFNYELLEKLPAGLVLDLTYKIMDISGLNLDELNSKANSMVNDLKGF